MSNDTGKDKFQFPVLPESLNVTADSENEAVKVAGLGEITIIQDPSAEYFEWSCHFPAVAHQGSISKPLDPQTYIDKIKSWRASKKPVKFTVTDPKISLFCSIESFSYYEQGGDPGTFYYTIKLKQYIEPVIRKLDKTPATPATPPASTPAQAATTPTYSKGKVKTNGSRLMLRQKASTSSKILAKMPNGSSLQIKSKSGSWYAVIYNNINGYAYAQWVKKL